MNKIEYDKLSLKLKEFDELDNEIKSLERDLDVIQNNEDISTIFFYGGDNWRTPSIYANELSIEIVEFLEELYKNKINELKETQKQI